LFSGRFLGFVSEQMLTLAYDAARQAAPRRMQCRDDESDDAVLFWLDEPIRNPAGWPDHEISMPINFRERRKRVQKRLDQGTLTPGADRHPCRWLLRKG
jgi:hypothetical protein